jgi:hypothetical protein
MLISGKYLLTAQLAGLPLLAAAMPPLLMSLLQLMPANTYEFRLPLLTVVGQLPLSPLLALD